MCSALCVHRLPPPYPPPYLLDPPPTPPYLPPLPPPTSPPTPPQPPPNPPPYPPPTSKVGGGDFVRYMSKNITCFGFMGSVCVPTIFVRAQQSQAHTSTLVWVFVWAFFRKGNHT